MKKNALRNKALIVIDAFIPACSCECCQKPVMRLSLTTKVLKSSNIESYQLDINNINKFYDKYRVYITQLTENDWKLLIKQVNSYAKYIEEYYA